VQKTAQGLCRDAEIDMAVPLSYSGTRLPPGTVVALHTSWLCLSHTSESPRGRRVLRSRIPIAYVKDRGSWPRLHEAVRDFTLAVALTALDDKTLPAA